VTVSPSRSAYAPGSAVKLTANADFGYDFSGWSGSATGNANPLVISMTTNQVINASFSLNLIGRLLHLQP